MIGSAGLRSEAPVCSVGWEESADYSRPTVFAAGRVARTFTFPPSAATVVFPEKSVKPAHFPKPEAKEAFDRLRPLSARIDLHASPYDRLGPIAVEFGYGADWRQFVPPPADIGARPDLAALGSFRWSPAPAPSFTAVAPDGSAVSLDSYRGKPVIVIFYLGHGCLHCATQLQAFAPQTQSFAEAGISLLAISTDPPR